MAEEDNVINIRNFSLEMVKKHTKKALIHLGKAETAFKEGKNLWGKKYTEMAQKEISVACKWQKKVEQLNSAGKPIYASVSDVPFDRESYTKWLNNQYQHSKI